MKHIPTELPIKTDDLLDLAEDQGWKVERTSKNHYKLTSPAGEIVGHSGTPSDHRAVLNFRAELKRKGLLPYVAPPEKPAPLVMEQQVESTPPETMETTTMTEKKPKAAPMQMQPLVIKILREHDKPDGMSSPEIWEFARVVVPKVTKVQISSTLNYGRTKGVFSKTNYRGWRLAEFGGATAKTKEDDLATLEAALKSALDAMATIEKVVRKLNAQHKDFAKLREFMAKMG